MKNFEGATKKPQQRRSPAEAPFMERRFGPSGFDCLVLGSLFFLLVGCSAGRAVSPVSSSEAPDPTYYLNTARDLAAQGQSSRAEEYYIAALQAGADPDVVFPLLIETCVQAGRLGSALVHVERHLRSKPEDPRLLRLASSLNEALGHWARAAERVEQLVQTAPLRREDALFLGGFFMRRGDDTQSRKYLSLYCASTPEQEQEPWVRALVRQWPKEATLVARDVSTPEESSHE